MPKTARSGDQARNGRAMARILLDIGAVAIRPQEPFTFTAGWKSPVYIDCRKLISFPAERRQAMEMAVRLIAADVGFDAIDKVAGGETAGIPYAAWIAEATGKPMLYVRKQPKGFGRNAQIEGDPKDGDRVLLVEDLTTDGGSKVRFADALRRAGMTVSHTFVVFYYGVFPGARETLAAAGLGLHYLADWWDVLAEAEATEDMAPEAIAAAREFLADPVAWSVAHGGRGETETAGPTVR